MAETFLGKRRGYDLIGWIWGQDFQDGQDFDLTIPIKPIGTSLRSADYVDFTDFNHASREGAEPQR